MTRSLADQESPSLRRVLAALRGDPTDRVPFALWRHFYQDEQSPDTLAAATLEFAQGLDLDLVKLTPGSFYAIEDWGAEIHYSGHADRSPSLKRPVVRKPEEWRDLLSLDVGAGALAREMETIRLLRMQLRGQVPLLMTICSPLTIAYKLAGERVVEDLREAPQELHFGLAIITETTVRLAKQSLATGADGIFFVTQLASSSWLTEAEYETFGVHYDLMVLEAIQDASRITVLHLHGEDVFFALVNRYPVHAVNWDAGAASPSLAEAWHLTDRALMGGLSRELLHSGPPEAVVEQVRQAIQATRGRRLILAPSCALLPGTPEENLLAAREAVRSTPLYY